MLIAKFMHLFLLYREKPNELNIKSNEQIRLIWLIPKIESLAGQHTIDVERIETKFQDFEPIYAFCL